MLMLGLDRETDDLRKFDVEEVLSILYDIYNEEEDKMEIKGVCAICIGVLETLRDNGEVDNTEDIAVKNYLLQFYRKVKK